MDSEAKRSGARWSGRPAAVAALTLAGIAVGALVARLLEQDLPDFARWGAAAVITAVSFALALHHWRLLDEAAREAHKSAWFWGGSFGMFVYSMLVLLLLAPGAPDVIPSLEGRTDPVAYGAVGAFGLLLFQTVGYLVAWIGWWLSKR